VRKRGVKVPGDGFHVAFSAPTRTAVDAFHKAALAHGGKDNGGSGLHPEYGAHYYAAFVFDPDGYRIEAVENVEPGHGFDGPEIELASPPCSMPPGW
jgi:catechol 2,3-dioxygenase-like lactoylglutathione lyase family enzyme